MSEKSKDAEEPAFSPSPLFLAARDGSLDTLEAMLSDPAAERWIEADRKQGLSALAALAGPRAAKRASRSLLEILPKLFEMLEGDLVKPIGKAAWSQVDEGILDRAWGGRDSATPLELAIVYWSREFPEMASKEALRLSKAGWPLPEGALDSALRRAAWGGKVSSVKALLEAGADPNGANSRGARPLHGCVSLEAVLELLEAGADPLLPNGAGKAPAEIAADEGRDMVVKELLKASKAAKRAAQKRGGSIEADSAAPLFAALANKNAKLFRSILAAGSYDARGARNEKGELLLEKALESEMWVDAKKLIEKGASLNDEGIKGVPLWGRLLAKELGWRPKAKRVEGLLNLWAFALERGSVDLSARRRTGELEIDAIVGKIDTCWGEDIWPELEKRALGEGLARSPGDSARLAVRLLQAARPANRYFAEALGLRMENYYKESGALVRERMRARMEAAQEASADERRAILFEAARLPIFVGSRRDLEPLVFGMLEDAMELFHDLDLDWGDKALQGAGGRLGALIEKKRLEKSSRASEGAPPKSKRMQGL